MRSQAVSGWPNGARGGTDACDSRVWSADNVNSVETRDFWREIDESPMDQDYHYNRNAETYYLVGEALGRSMVDLLLRP